MNFTTMDFPSDVSRGVCRTNFLMNRSPNVLHNGVRPILKFHDLSFVWEIRVGLVHSSYDDLFLDWSLVFSFLLGSPCIEAIALVVY